MAHADFEAVIGLEVHTQLATETKIFCGCRARLPEGRSVADVEPNSNTCEICTAQPGALPVLNKKVVEFAIRAGLATHCEIRRDNVFARKNYFYPDLPKGYQISQFDRPICENGYLEIETPKGPKKIGIQRIHMEEDAGKNLHLHGYSLVNLNRAGVPLVEIVSHPELRSSTEAGAYLRALHAIVTYLGICDGNLQEGNFRCDANVSVMPRGAKTYGTRTEIKNVNSFRFIEKAIEFEIARQIEVIQAGGRVILETRGYDSAKNQTFSQRSKEEAQDYRYFPDPDLIPIHIEEKWIEEIRGSLPELPEQRRARYQKDFGLTPLDASAITSFRDLAEFFERTIECLRALSLDVQKVGKPAANWIAGELTRLLNDSGTELARAKITARHIADLVALTQKGAVSSTGAKQALASAWASGEAIETIVDRDGLKQASDLSAFEPLIDQVLAANPGSVADFKAGKEKILGFLVGQIMKQTGGKANPALLQELLRKKIGKL